jgi:hypothetical protein
LRFPLRPSQGSQRKVIIDLKIGAKIVRNAVAAARPNDMISFLDHLREAIAPLRRLIASLVIIFGPIYALYEYEGNKTQWRIDKALAVTSTLSVGSLSTSYNKLNLLDQEIAQKTGSLKDQGEIAEAIFRIGSEKEYVS